MKAPIALSWQEQLDLFKSRGMKVTDNDIDKIKNISYYRLKEFARPLSTISKKDGVTSISYNGVEFKEVLTRYYQDKNLRIYLLHAIEKIEVSIKTRISYVLGKKYGAFGYLNFSSWSNRKKYTKFQIEKEQFSIKKRLSTPFNYPIPTPNWKRPIISSNLSSEMPLVFGTLKTSKNGFLSLSISKKKGQNLSFLDFSFSSTHYS